jgi:hypothetical protein
VPIHEKYHSTIDLKNTIIAVSEDNSKFRTFSAEEISKCNKVGLFFVCENANVVRRADAPLCKQKDDGRCLFALITQDYKTIKDTCRIRISEAPDVVMQLSPTKFVTYNSNEHQGRINCAGDQSPVRQIFSANKFTVMELKPGCEAKTNSHIFAAPKNNKQRDWTLTYTVPKGMMDFTAHIDLNEFHQLRLRGESTLSNKSSFTVDEATKDWLETQYKSNDLIPDVTTHIIANWAIIAVGVISIMIIGAVIMCNKNKQQQCKDNGAATTTATATTNITVAALAPPACLLNKDEDQLARVSNRLFPQKHFN